MTVRVLVAPTGPKATPEAIEAWREKAQRAADELDAGLTINVYDEDGVTVLGSIKAVPGDEPFEDWGDEEEVGR